MNKHKETVINTLANLLLTFINLFVGFLTTRLVLVNYGSDYNGLNTTINQIITVMLVVESGFALSANVALYKPISEKNKQKIESILSAVNFVFLLVGIGFFVIGIVSSFLAPLVIKTTVNYWEIVLLFLLTLLPIGLRLIITMKYTTFLESIQKNYIINFVKIVTNIFVLISIYLIVGFQQPYIVIKVAYFGWNMLSIALLVVIFKIIYKQYKIGFNKNLNEIKGIKDVLIKKIASIVNSTFPALILGFLIGTEMVSVYGTYMLVISGITSVLGAIIMGPKDSLGLLIAEGDKDKTYDIFKKYSFMVFFFSALLLSTTAVLIIPFIKLYTAGVVDINYIRPEFAFIMVIGSFFGVLQGPYTHLLNGASIFKEAKIIQVIGAGSLIIVGTILTHFFGIIGLSISLLLHDLIVSLGKIFISHALYFKKGFKDLLKYLVFLIIPISVASILIIYFGNFDAEISNYGQFILYGLIISVVNILIILAFSFLPFKKTYAYFFKRVGFKPNQHFKKL
ncbi:MAG: hypothetical protein RBQ97_06515 [Acholeplasma sp.]|nr:hypothetical protein [Acholeplasma sp.]